MYSIVLMAALTTGATEPGFGWRCGCHGSSYGCSGCAGCYGGGYGCGGYGCGGGYGYGYNAGCSCYGASSIGTGYGYCCGCYGGYCMGGFTNYAPAVIAPAPVRPEKPEVVPKPKPKVDETSLNKQARLIVEVPADAKLLIDGTPMRSTSRVFRTPKLDPKLTYFYDVTAEVVRDGKTVSSTKRVIVRAGEEVHTAFADLPANKGEATASAGK